MTIGIKKHRSLFDLDASGGALGFAASLVEESCPKRLFLYLDVKIDSLQNRILECYIVNLK